MLEGLVAWVLNNYLGKYVENLNTAQLSIALLSGEVELENLPLKNDALRNLGLPVQIKGGFIGKIKLQIPVRQIKSAPWVIIIEQLYLVATPLPVHEWDSEKEEIIAQDLKIGALDNLEARWRFENDAKESATYYSSSYSSWLSYGTGFITDIIENLQLKIRDVHIRYEDNISIPNVGVAFGITMESLSAQSCDENWQPGFTHWDSSLASFKIIEMQKLSIYWIDLDNSQLLSNLNRSDLTASMTSSSGSNNNYMGKCILSPVSAQARIKRNRSEQPLRSYDTPRIVCDLELEEVPLMLIDWQYDQIVKCMHGLDNVARFRAYRKYRPLCTVKEDARAWWLYAISCLYPGRQPNICRPKQTWDSTLQRARENVKYFHIYAKILLTPTLALNPDDKKLKDDVEWAREFDELRVLRELAMKSVPNSNRNGASNNSAGRSMLVRWFPQWMGWYSSSVDAQPNEAGILEGEILQALSDTIENNTLLKRDTIFGKFSFVLKSGNLSLCTTHEDTKETVPMIELQFKNLCLNILSKPRTASHSVELSLGALYLCDKFTHNTLFPVLVGPPGQERTTPAMRSRGPSPRVSVTSKFDGTDFIFHMTYDKKPENSKFDYRLTVKTKSLDVVYQPAAVKWLVEFLCLPHQRTITHSRIEAMKSRTRKELMKNWEQILDGRINNRKCWDLLFDITAPQIFFVEQFNDPNSAIAVVDFGRFHIRNNMDNAADIGAAAAAANASGEVRKDDDEEMFMTPCSTPPASEETDSDHDTFNNILPLDNLNEASLHLKIYDRYAVELNDMQILIGKVKDNWRYAHNKGTSTLHVLDRFTISLQIERRIIHTYDPTYPSFTLNANLPRLVTHFNEYKIASARKLTQIITATGLPSPFNTPDSNIEDVILSSKEEDNSLSYDTSKESSRLFILQFSVDYLSMEVQSRGRSVAELQVSGVKMAFTKRPIDMNLTLSVHSLLLADALQTFGADFELLVASHKHVGMDSISGSLRDSEPTSPTSPASPDPSAMRINATSPVALSQALTSLATSPPGFPAWSRSPDNRGAGGGTGGFINDAEALITLELLLVFGAQPIQIANIQFNNLDIIANQGTIVELMGFIRRVFPELKSQKSSSLNAMPVIERSLQSSNESLIDEKTPSIGTTEITFDFHRLNVLLLRGVPKDGYMYGKKICTATMTEAKIQATVDNGVTIEGSLGGLQVIDLTPEGHMHQRIISVGHDPIFDHPLYSMVSLKNDYKAFSFKIVRSLLSDSNDQAEITVRMASLWYTHSPQFFLELQSCASEFKQYLSNLAKSIKSAATDVALGLVHARAEVLAQSIYMNSRLSTSIYGSALSFTDFASPRRRRRSSSMAESFSGYSSVRDTVPQTPYSPTYEDDFHINLKLDIVLDSPVLILPRSNNCSEVFVAHLGKITISNNKSPDIFTSYETQENRVEHYDIEVRDISLFSLDTASRRVPGPLKPEHLYACETLAKPILHDTVLNLEISRELPKRAPSRQQSIPNLLLDDDDDRSPNDDWDADVQNIEISGVVITELKVSLTRAQYEQLLDTVQWLTATPKINEPSAKLARNALTDISEEDTGVSTLNMDPHVRAKLFQSVKMPTSYPKKSKVYVKVQFEMPIFTIELRGDSPTGEQGLVDLSFRDFSFIYDKCHLYETNIHVSLRSIHMEDLLQPEGSKHRSMVISSSGDEIPIGPNCVSRSCPDIYANIQSESFPHGSLPDHFETNRVMMGGGGMERSNTIHIESTNVNGGTCPCTPPPSPTARSQPVKNLVLVTTLLVDPEAPNFNTVYNAISRSTSVDFNCLDLVINESWVVVIDFFSASASEHTNSSSNAKQQGGQVSQKEVAKIEENTETNITVRSLTIVLVLPDRDVAKANISNVEIAIKRIGPQKEVIGKLGSISLLDLTLHGHLYCERFLTSGKEALTFKYIRHGSNQNKDYDSQLNLNMSSVFYVHTKRFVAEIQAFFNHFNQLQAIMAGIRAATSGQKMSDNISRLSLVLQAESPVILLPVSSRSSRLIIVDLGQLKVTNCFKFSGEEGTISDVSTSATDKKCLLDVMLLDLQNVNLQAGERESDSHIRNGCDVHCYYKLGNSTIKCSGKSLLTEKCHLKIQVERNLNSNVCHNVPDMSIHGELSTLDATLDLSQYKLIRGFLAHNLGENTEHILPSVQPPPVTAEPNIRDLWTLSSLRLDLMNVTVRLQKCSTKPSPLACINFIKSRLTVESFSNLSQDIDLVSQEILITDTRFSDLPENSRSNVFSNILLPISQNKHNDLVQVEVHSRKRQEHFKFTILLNNMRLMAVFDWWEQAREFILQDIEDASASPTRQRTMTNDHNNRENVPFELKLNITDSQIVVVEDTSLYETNAVILKSTTVITYRSTMIDKPLSCNLNNCEVYSCVLGMEDETALSIIDPVTLNIEITRDKILEFQLHTLNVRLSYYDVHMFVQILNSLPKQLFAAKKDDISPQLQRKLDKLVALGFTLEDCMRALEQSEQRIDDAALWLTQNAVPSYILATNDDERKIVALEVKADNIFLCIIDDCGDADVPLLELSLSKLFLRQGLYTNEATGDSPTKGAIECVLASDYYNRVLSGWEPIIEPFQCIVMWDHTLSQNVAKNRLQLSVNAKDSLNINITSTFTELCKQVTDSWTQDLTLFQNKTYRRRSPFVPYLLKNDTGLPLYYTTIISNMDDYYTSGDEICKSDTIRWKVVEPGDTVSFSFKLRAKIRHSDSHKMKMHQLGVQIEGYQHIAPVTVDKVGVYFRHAEASIQTRAQQEVPKARIVFDVALAGSAKKLVTVRSALQVVNKLLKNIEVKLESQLPYESNTLWTSSKIFILTSGCTLSVPLVHVYSNISVRPVDTNEKYTYCNPPINWEQSKRPVEFSHEIKSCHSHRGKVYRFCTEIKREKYPPDKAVVIAGQFVQPAHTITLLPTILLVNLLPVDMNYAIADEAGRVGAGDEIAMTYVNTDESVYVKITLESFPTGTTLVIPVGTTILSARIRLEDTLGRKLVLNASISPHSDSKIKITISAPFWIINKTGLPLVFRQSGVSAESAGQFQEHEVARIVSPLLFSFADTDANSTCVARVGTHVVSNGLPQWSHQFHLQRGIQVKRLRVTVKDGRPDVVFLVGIEVRPGRGKYRQTSIVTIAPRYQLHNNSSYMLLFAQKCYTTNSTDPSYLKAMPNCHMPFHWPRLDQEQLLTVQIQDVPNCNWSGGLKIDSNYSMHVNIRDGNGRMYFMRLEVILQGATYFAVFTDADTMPPPIRVDNFSEVSVKFAQACCRDIVHSVARAHTSVPYAWDEPTQASLVVVEAPGGVMHTYDINKLGKGVNLTYENFIYIAFTGTFKKDRDITDPLNVETQELVLDVINNKVVLGRKEHGRRSQLWRMTSTSQLQHEGSSPPLHPHQPRTDNILVLDIQGPAPQPSSYSQLVLRPPDPRRKSTQTWRFTEEGRLCCVHHNMCVQAQDGFFGLRQGNAAVLGLPQAVCHRTTDTGIPLEQAVSRQRLRPGSGFLSVEISTDGPTRVISISDLNERRRENMYASPDERDWSNIAIRQRPILNLEQDDDDAKQKELQFTLHLVSLGVSLVSRRPPQEILYAQFTNIIAETLLKAKSKRFCVSVEDIQIDNQMLDAPMYTFLYVTPPTGRVLDDAHAKLPALDIVVEMQPIQNENAIIFNHLIVKLKKLTIHLEERLLLKLLEFIGYNASDEELCNIGENDYETQRMLTKVAASHMKRYYFGVLKLVPDQIRLSMKTASKLTPSLQYIKKKSGLTFIKFEDAGVDLEPYLRHHLFETMQVLKDSVIKHFKDELVWQAGIILGSVDFLGNPLGFVNDVSEGVSGLIYEGNVGALVKNVTHGISNSAAKVTESLSDGLGRVAMDDEHEEMRQKIRQVESGKSRDHLIAGIKGLGFGVLGGATGIFKQVYEGASNEGIQGVFSGIGKGIVGAFTKPVVGVLDLASETARAVRTSSRSSSRMLPDRSRPSRCVLGPGGLLPRFSLKQSIGQQYLYSVNDRQYNEQLVAYECLGSGAEDLRVIISNMKIRFVTSANSPNLTSVIETHLSDLEKCRVIQESEGDVIRYYIELTVHVSGTSVTLVYQDPVKKPKVRCDSHDVAKVVTRQINYAKRLYDERKHTLSNDDITQNED